MHIFKECESGKVVVITGASSLMPPLFAVLARQFHSAGAKVIQQ